MTATTLALLAALQIVPDQGVLTLRRDTVEVGRESFRVTAAPSRGDTSWTVWVDTRFDHARPRIALNPVLVVDRDSQPSTLQYEISDARGARTVLGQLARNRLTLREVSPGAERAREYHVPGRAVLVDDSVFTLFAVAAWHARAEPVTVTAVHARTGRRETLTVTDRGVESTIVNRDAARLRHITISGGASGPVEVWVGADGRLMKVEIPQARLRAERRPGD